MVCLYTTQKTILNIQVSNVITLMSHVLLIYGNIYSTKLVLLNGAYCDFKKKSHYLSEIDNSLIQVSY